MTDPDTSESQTTVTPHKHRHPKQEQEPASEEVTEVAPDVIRTQLPVNLPGLTCKLLRNRRQTRNCGG